MNDVDERDIYDLRRTFERREGDVASFDRISPSFRQRIRRRQTGNVVAVISIALVVVGGSVAALRTISATGTDGIGTARPTTTTSINGITMTYPDPWYAVDPVVIGAESADPERTLPSLILSLTRDDPTIEDVLGCPMLADVPPGQVLMTIQEVPRSLAGDAAHPWPVTLAPWEEAGASSGGCYGGWTFMRAQWTTQGRSFDARAGFAADASDEDRQALIDAFDSMVFSTGSVSAEEAVTLGAGTAFGSTSWDLTARLDGEYLCWSLNWGDGGFGACAGAASPDRPSVESTPAPPEGAFAVAVLPSDVEAVTLESEAGGLGDLGLFPIPAGWGDAKLTVIPLPGSGTGLLRLQDRRGRDMYPPERLRWGEGASDELPWENLGGTLTGIGTAGPGWKVEVLYLREGVRLTIGEEVSDLGVLRPGEPIIRALDDDGYDAILLVLTGTQTDRVAVLSEGTREGRWMPASTGDGREARLWVIELPGAGTGTLLLDDVPAGEVSWPG